MTVDPRLETPEPRPARSADRSVGPFHLLRRGSLSGSVASRNRAALRVVVIALFAMLLVQQPAEAAPQAGVPKNAQYFEAYFPYGEAMDTLHADVLRPKGIGKSVKTPVILTVTPYTNHSGDPLEVGFTNRGPSDRFYDFLKLSDALDRGYTYVMVDLPGFGGSSGCNDWGGDREQSAVVAAVEWAASQSWSTGKVAMLGKSYDAWTGLMGVAHEPKGLAAVVAMEPVFDGYNYHFNSGVRFVKSVTTPTQFQVFDAKPGSVYDSPKYHVNGAPQAYCYGVNVGLQQIDAGNAPFWRERQLLPLARGSKVPLFLTQGLLEVNTKPDQAFRFFNSLAGRENRAWYGQFDHVRGWEKTADGKRTQTGRTVDAFIDQVMDFLDEHLKDRGNSQPGINVQDNLGHWRTEQAWPPADTRIRWSTLNNGVYTDDANNVATGDGSGHGVWTISQPLEHKTWIAGQPQVRVQVRTKAPRANLVGLVYDVAPDGKARVVSRGAQLLRSPGAQVATLPLYGQDWVLRAGHRIAVLVSGSDLLWWTHVPTLSEVVINKAAIGLPFLTRERRSFLPGGSTPRLEEHLKQFASISDATIRQTDRTFRIPGPLR